MKNKKQFFSYAGMILAGIIIGWMIFGGNNKNLQQPVVSAADTVKQVTTWTCSMHPQIRQDKPGKCPICGMDLIPLNTGNEDNAAFNITQMSESAMKIAEVQTTIVQKSVPVMEIRLQGKVKPDERKNSVITARFAGRIEKLFVNFTGQQVRQGERLVTIYSPDMIMAQKELFEAIKFKQSNPEYYKAARNKLKLWSLSERQINQLESKGEPQNYFDVLSPLGGTVMKKEVAPGDYVEAGTMLFEIADLSTVWIQFDAYESDLPWIQPGDAVTFELQSQPGKVFTSKVTFIDPFVNPEARVAYVRTETANPGNLLKPEMFVRGTIKSGLPVSEDALIIPKSAVLWTGKKAVVYVKLQAQEKPTFEYREITLGEDAGSFYVVKNGLQEGEEIVTNGVFKIDAAAQLAGKQSMMNPDDVANPKEVETANEIVSDTTTQTQINPVQEMVVNQKVKDSFQLMVLEYMSLKDALVADNLSDAKLAAGKLQETVNKVDMSLLTGASHDTWMKYSTQIKNALKHASQLETIEDMRKAFQQVSNAMIALSGSFKPFQKPLYVQFCPMADDNKGAYWISLSKEIRNPYFGESMLTCGEIKKIIN